MLININTKKPIDDSVSDTDAIQCVRVDGRWVSVYFGVDIAEVSEKMVKAMRISFCQSYIAGIVSSKKGAKNYDLDEIKKLDFNSGVPNTWLSKLEKLSR